VIIGKNKDYQEFVQKNFLLWQYEKTSEPGKRFITYYHIYKYPAIIILDPRTKAKVHEINMPDDFSKFIQIHDQLTAWIKERATPSDPKPKSSHFDQAIQAFKQDKKNSTATTITTRNSTKS